MESEKPKIKLSELTDMYDIEDDGEESKAVKVKDNGKSNVQDFDSYTLEVDELEDD